MKPKYLTFDCYGTLIDWKTGINASLRKVMGEVQLDDKSLLDSYVNAEKTQEAGYRKYREVLASSAERVADSFGKELSKEGASRFAESVPEWPAFPDTAETLRELGSRGFKRYILSNVDTDLLLKTIEAHRLEIDGYVTAEQVGSYKPARGHWDRFKQKTGADDSEILHVAQSLFHDIAPTQMMGISSAWVNRYAEPLPEDLSPAYVADSLAHLASMLD